MKPILACVLVSLACTAAAQSVVPLPAARTQGDVSYVTGGIGEDAARSFEAAARDWPLTVQFAEQRTLGNVWLAAVPVTVRGADGRIVLETVTEGPFLLLRVPPGRYDISAQYHGTEKRRSVSVPAANGATRLMLLW